MRNIGTAVATLLLALIVGGCGTSVAGTYAPPADAAPDKLSAPDFVRAFTLELKGDNTFRFRGVSGNYSVSDGTVRLAPPARLGTARDTLNFRIENGGKTLVPLSRIGGDVDRLVKLSD
jgi:hypothetical protein